MSKNTIDEVLDGIDFELRPLMVGGTKYADEAVITGKDKAKQALYQDLLSMQKRYTIRVNQSDGYEVTEEALPVEVLKQYFGKE